MTPAAAGAGDAEDAALPSNASTIADLRGLSRNVYRTHSCSLPGQPCIACRQEFGLWFASVVFPFQLAAQISLRLLLKSHASKLSCPLRRALPSLRLTPPVAG